MLAVIQSFMLTLVAYTIIFGGLAFTNERLTPSILGTVYENTGFFIRLVIFSCIICFLANFMLAKAYQISSASIVGPMLIGVVVIVSVANSMFLDQVKLTLPITAATILALASCALVSWLLVKQKQITG